MLFHTFIATTMTRLVTTLAKHTDGERLWDAVRIRIRQTYAALPHTPATRDDQRTLLNEPIPTKPYTFMRLDPNTTLWAYQPNPLTD